MEELLQNRELKFIFCGGKGGVGKTTTSGALAIQLSYDRKVLLISTDPAHSLSDAFRLTFSNEPTPVPEAPNLEVMEVNPADNLQNEVARWAEAAQEVGFDELTSKVSEFQEWLTGIPGIDEATALASVVGLIESGTYDVIVFDTAPTGHTLKLLQLPQIIQLGLDKLDSWQATMWNYWQGMKAAMGAASTDAGKMREMVKERLKVYQDGIAKVGAILTDPARTSFVVVCIAEFLSISESRRLLAELKRFNVGVSHAVVNQLVQGCVPPEQLEPARQLLSRAHAEWSIEQQLLEQINTSITLSNARASIQAKYLAELKNSPEAAELTIVELPLLASEVTGAPALLDFSQRMVADGYRGKAPSKLVDWQPSPMVVELPEEPAAAEEAEEPGVAIGDHVVLQGLVKKPEYNGLAGSVLSFCEDGRVSVEVTHQGKKRKLAMKLENLAKTEDAPEVVEESAKPSAGGMLDGLLDDPEIQKALENPRIKAAYEDVQANPMSFMKYLSDPEIQPVIAKCMGKLGGGGGKPKESGGGGGLDPAMLAGLLGGLNKQG